MAKLYLISQDKNNGYDTFDSAVVVAEDEEEAMNIHPSGRKDFDNWSGSWVDDPKYVTVELLGNARKDLKVGTVICASFNAG